MLDKIQRKQNLSNLAFLQNLEDIDTFKKYSEMYRKCAEIIFGGEEIGKIHVSTRYGIYFNLEMLMNDFAANEKLI